MLVGTRVLSSPMEVEFGSRFKKQTFGKFSEILLLKNNVILQPAVVAERSKATSKFK